MTDGQTDRHTTDGQTDDSRTDRQTDRHTYKYKQDRQTDIPWKRLVRLVKLHTVT